MKKYLLIFIACFWGGFLMNLVLTPPPEMVVSPCLNGTSFDIFDRRPVEQRYVVVNLFAGFGNQMFQYAAAYAYGKAHNKTVVVTGGSETFSRAFGLNFIRFQKDDICFFPAMSTIRRREVGAKSHTGQKVSGFLNDPDIIFMVGYFQNERFFKKYAADIRNLFAFQGDLPIETEKLKTEIESQNAVSIHIRRTDYVSSGYYYVLSVGYYKRAMKYIARNVDNPHFYIFSDDIDWVENNMDFNYPHTFVKINKGRDSYLDMYLMSLCKHNIIANSTFSWWGAWLNKNPDKIVIAPDVWGFSTDPYEQTKKRVKEIVPDEWIILSNVPKGEED